MAKDLMFQDEVKEVVRGAYAAISTGGGRTVAGRIYTDDELAELPGGAVDWALGVGNPVLFALLQPGEVVLDIGSGAGIDTILAARRVGPEGRAIGLDIVPAMSKRARAHAATGGRHVQRDSRKSRALAEILRVLRPGGRISLADLTVEEELPPEIANDESAWAG